MRVTDALHGSAPHWAAQARRGGTKVTDNPKNEQDEGGGDEGELDLAPDALKDLTADQDTADEVAGGATTPGRNQCYNGTW